MVTINAVTSNIDNNISAENIKNGVNILGVIGNVIELNSTNLDITPSILAQSFTPQSPYNGYNIVNISAVTASIDNNISAENIKSGINILGIAGTYEGIIPEQDYYDCLNIANNILGN